MSDIHDLNRQIDDLALRLVVGGSEAFAASVSTLVQIRDRGGAESHAHISAAAAVLLDILQAPESDRKTAAVQDAFARLQQAVELDSQERKGGEASPECQSLAQDPELLSDFVVESREHLVAIEAQVLTLERDPGNSEALHSIFRGFHTIKGLAGFLELGEVQILSHEVEAILDRARNSQLTVSALVIDVILESADCLKRWLTHLEAALQGQPSVAPGRDGALLAKVRAISSGSSSGPLAVLAEVVEAGGAKPDGPAGESTSAAAEGSAVDNPASGRRNDSLAIKVDTAKLDSLVDMAGEMVIAESLVRHDPEFQSSRSPRLQRNLAQLTRITAELQKTAMSMRLVPIGPLFRRMARLVRDLSRQFSKQVRLETEGDDIELDRTIVEALSDPLMHMVRNALDHGIESPQERQAAGKSSSARLLLRAQHQAGHVVIEISDDGRGLDRGKIARKAIEKGLIATAEGMSDHDVFSLIFEPGFSTAATVTNVSGRGVGMDVVRRHVEKLRGRIEIRSAANLGSTFLLKLPLTLAIIDGLVVGVGSERYILPLFAVREMFRPGEDAVWTVQGRSEMVLVRDTLLPMVRLYRTFGVKPKSEDPRQSVLIVAESESRRYCLLVDDLIGKQEVVIKSLGETFKNISGIAGGAILGDGRVGLILELDRLFKDRGIDTER